MAADRTVGEGEASFRALQDELAARIEREGPLLPARQEIPAKAGNGRGQDEPSVQRLARAGDQGLPGRILNIVALDSVMGTEPEPIHWVIDFFAPTGSLCLLSGYNKTGKSTLATALAIAVGSGRPFLGMKSSLNKVLWLSAEESERDIVRRFNLMGAEPGNNNICILTEDFPPTAESIEALMKTVSAEGFGLVILDTLNTYSRMKDEKDNAEANRVMLPLRRLVRMTGTTLFAMAHATKAGAEGGRAVRGASAFGGAVDHIWEIERRQGGSTDNRILKYTGRCSDIQPEIVIGYGDDGYQALGTRRDMDLEAAMIKVLSVLTRTEPITEAEVIQRTGLNRPRVYRAIGGLGNAVHRTGAGIKADPFLFSLPG